MIDPAKYPHRAMFVGTNPQAATVIVWIDAASLPLSGELADAIDTAFTAGGHALVMARTDDLLARAGRAVAVIASPYLDGGQCEPECVV